MDVSYFKITSSVDFQNRLEFRCLIDNCKRYYERETHLNFVPCKRRVFGVNGERVRGHLVD